MTSFQKRHAPAMAPCSPPLSSGVVKGQHNARENPSHAGAPGLAPSASSAGRKLHAAHAAPRATALVTPLRPFGVTVPPC